jgi:hypothetical protein
MLNTNQKQNFKNHEKVKSQQKIVFEQRDAFGA